MMRTPSWIACRAALLVSVTLAAASPLTVDEDGFRARTAECQDGTCCPEEKSTCIVGSTKNLGYFYQSAGSCKVRDS